MSINSCLLQCGQENHEDLKYLRNFSFVNDQYYNKDQDLRTGTLVPEVFLAIFLQERAREKQGSKGREKTSKTSGNSVVN